MKKESLTYAKAISRLEEIVRKLEEGETSVDELSAIVREGVELIAWCREKLRSAQKEVEAALATLDEPAEGGDPPSKKNASKTASAGSAAAGKAVDTEAGLFAGDEENAVGEEGLEPPTYSV